MEESKTYYKCGVCGKSHSTLEDRNACEAKCLKARKEAEVALKKQKLEEEKAKRMDEIDAAIKHLQELFKDYINDYGSIKLSNYGAEVFPSLSRMFESWWF